VSGALSGSGPRAFLVSPRLLGSAVPQGTLDVPTALRQRHLYASEWVCVAPHCPYWVSAAPSGSVLPHWVCAGTSQYLT
jgi:hypothetical protein